MNRMRKLHLQLSGLAVAASTALLLTASAALAGGPEYDCAGSMEKWAPIPFGGIPWYLGRRMTPNGVDCPGYPSHGCPSGSPNDKPAVQSAHRASQTWSNAKVPITGSMAPATTFKLTDGPAGYMAQGLSTRLLNAGTGQADNTNVVTMVEPPTSFVPFGGVATYGVCLVGFAPGTTTISESDIAINTRSVDPNSKFISYVETNAFLGQTLASGPAQPLSNSVLAYVDLEGALTTLFGYFAGLGASMVESEYNNTNSRLPTMTATAAQETYSNFVYYGVSGVCNGTGFNVSGLLTGAGLKTLEDDDISAIGTAYPSSQFQTDLRSLSGTIYQVVKDPSTGINYASPWDGIHVTAVSMNDPSIHRVGMITRGGAYTVPGLSPGTYFVYAEIPDLPFGVSAVPYYPSYGSAPGYASCVNYPTVYFTPDIYTQGENIGGVFYGYCEGTTSCNVTVVDLSFSSAAGKDIYMLPSQLVCHTNFEPALPLAVARAGAVGNPSPRGLVLPSTGGNVTLTMTFLLAVNGTKVDVLVSPQLGNSVSAIHTLTQVGGPSLYTWTNAATIQSGKASLTFDPFALPGMPTTHANVFIQARIGDNISNLVNVRKP